MAQFELPDRFWAKTEIDHSTGCINWTAYKGTTGYGEFCWQGKKVKAHRLVMMAAGLSVDGLVVMHLCDNPLCVSVAHLRVGTHAENIADRDAKGRGQWHGKRGESNAGAKLSETTVREILRAHKNAKRSPSGRIVSGELVKIARHFSIPYGTMRNITDRRMWTHIKDI